MPNGKTDPTPTPEVEAAEAPPASTEPVVTPEPPAVSPHITADQETVYPAGVTPPVEPDPMSDDERAARAAELAPPSLA